MDKDMCRQAISYIKPREGFIGETLKLLRLNKSNAVRKRKISKIAGLGGIAAAVRITVALAAATGLFASPASPKESPSVIAHGCE